MSMKEKRIGIAPLESSACDSAYPDDLQMIQFSRIDNLEGAHQASEQSGNA